MDPPPWKNRERGGTTHPDYPPRGCRPLWSGLATLASSVGTPRSKLYRAAAEHPSRVLRGLARAAHQRKKGELKTLSVLRGARVHP